MSLGLCSKAHTALLKIAPLLVEKTYRERKTMEMALKVSRDIDAAGGRKLGGGTNKRNVVQ